MLNDISLNNDAVKNLEKILDETICDNDITKLIKQNDVYNSIYILMVENYERN